MDKTMPDNLQQFLSYFYEPKVTAYEFMKCFFACLYKKNVTEIDRDLASFLWKQKNAAQKGNDESSIDVLEEINFRSNGVNYYSDDIEDAIFNLQNGGLLGKMNPSFGRIILKYSDEDYNKAVETIKNLSESYLGAIEKIADSYVSTTVS